MEEKEKKAGIDELAGLCGIVEEYWDIFGKKHTATAGIKREILRAMKVGADSDEEIRAEIGRRKDREWTRVVKPVLVFSVNEQPLAIPLSIPLPDEGPDDRPVRWAADGAEGHVADGSCQVRDCEHGDERIIGGKRYVRISLVLPHRLGIGYYSLGIRLDDEEHAARLIIAPDSCYLPPELRDGKLWGISVNLYALRSARDWGIGDMGSLAEMVDVTSGIGGSYVGINPLHSIPNTYPYGISPYSPISRLFRNFIYIDVGAVPEVAGSPDMGRFIGTGEFRAELEEMRAGDRVDYERVSGMKKTVLRKAFDVFTEQHLDRGTARGKEFEQFLEREGRDLESYCTFMALRDHMIGSRNVWVWQEWPEEYRDPDSAAVEEFRSENRREILFTAYLQWLLDSQLARVSDGCHERGMPVGLYHDLAIGAVGGGSDVWSHRDLFGDADVGAPPDDFSPNGQNWGFPPMTVDGLEETGYDLFIRTMKKNMKNGGAIRIDHALGLFRLFWVPFGVSPTDGAYVQYPSEDLLRIIALESVLNRTLVIAEDLGTIGENARETLQEFGMLSYRLFYFERNYPEPTFLPAEKYPERALCSVTTHDLPTLSGYWVSRDIVVKKELGSYPEDAAVEALMEERERDKKLILDLLNAAEILPPGFPDDPESVPGMTPELCTAIYGFLAQTPCSLVLVSLDDIIGTLNQQNMPGTVGTHPNWIQKTPVSVADMTGDARFERLAEMFRRSGRSSRRR